MKHRTLRVQPLELRALLAIDVSFDLLTGDLNILGGPTNDIVDISANALTVTARVNDGATSNSYSFARALVRSISIRGGDGDDQLSNSSNMPVSLYGQGGNDTLNGGSANDTIRGGDGNDILRGGGGDDSVLGEAGNDELYGNDGNDRVDGGEGDDRIRGGEGDDVLFGGNGRDQLLGESGSDTLVGGELRDYLYGGLGNDILRGGDGNDVLRGEDGDDQLFGDAGNDSLRGEAGNDRLDGDVGDDLLYGGPGDDALDGGSGNDTLTGDEGNDRLVGREGNDFLYGGPGNDDLRGDAGLNQLFGDHGDDVLIGGPDAEVFWGGAGNDLLRGYGGNDLLYGEVGFDTLYGDDGDDVLDGGDEADILWAGDGNDQLFGGDGGDLLNGEAGDDRMRGGAGNDTITAGVGRDTVNGDDGDDFINGGDGDDELFGGPGSDLIRGGAGNDHLRGLDGSDTLYGDDGADIVVGGQGSDTLYGGYGSDLLIGGEHDDRLWGSDGSDLLIGGTTVYDDSAARLRSVLDAWIGAIEFQGSPDSLYVSNKSIELRPGDTVLNDDAVDHLEGDTGWDSFFWFASDTLSDRSADEPVASGDVSVAGWANRVYLDLFAAPATPAQISALAQRIERGASRTSLVLELMQSNEFRAEQLRRVYRQTFGSDITDGELTLQLLLWGQGQDLERLWAGYLASPEFAATQGGDNAKIIQAMFNIVVRRTASDDEIGAWLETLAQTSTAEVAYQLITSYEVQVARVNEWYRDFLHRAPTAPQVANRIQQLASGISTDHVRAALLISGEYLNQPYFDVADFGATVNDSTDDSLALQTALDIADMSGNSVVYVGPGLYVADNLRIQGSNMKLIGPGTLRLKDRSASVGVLTIDGNDNVVSHLKIDGNKNGMHTGRAEGLRVVGNNNRIFRVEVANTYQDDSSDPSGQNFVVSGSLNSLIETRSLNAGHSGYRQLSRQGL